MITFGTHYLLTIAQSERQKVRDFYSGLLGCQLQSSDGQTENIPDNLNLFVFPGEEVVGM